MNRGRCGLESHDEPSVSASQNASHSLASISGLSFRGVSCCLRGVCIAFCDDTDAASFTLNVPSAYAGRGAPYGHIVTRGETSPRETFSVSGTLKLWTAARIRGEISGVKGTISPDPSRFSIIGVGLPRRPENACTRNRRKCCGEESA